MFRFGAPTRISSPASDLTIGVRESAVTSPSLISASMAGIGAKTRSKASSSLIRFVNVGLKPLPHRHAPQVQCGQPPCQGDSLPGKRGRDQASTRRWTRANRLRRRAVGSRALRPPSPPSGSRRGQARAAAPGPRLPLIRRARPGFARTASGSSTVAISRRRPPHRRARQHVDVRTRVASDRPTPVADAPG